MHYISEEYLNSKEAKLALKVQDCDLAHIRGSGKLKFVKKGNAFMYSKECVNKLKSLKKKNLK
jgi:hypothetical protein